MKKKGNFVLPILFAAGLWAVSAYVGPDTWHSWTPYLLGAFTLFLYAYFQTKIEDIQLDMDAIEEALDRIEPNYHHQVSRFRYGRSRPDIPNPRVRNETD